MSVADRVRDRATRRPRVPAPERAGNRRPTGRAGPPVGGRTAFGRRPTAGLPATPGGPPPGLPTRRPAGYRAAVRPAHPAPIISPDELALEVHALGLAHGLDAIGIASAEPLLRARAALEERKAAGLHAGMDFTFRRPVRSTTPSELVEGAAAIVVGARRYESILPPRPDARGPYGAVARYAWTDHYGPLKEALGTVAAHLRRNGYRARVLADDNGLVDREVAHRAGLGWFGKNANLLRPGAGSWFVLGSVVTERAAAGQRGARRRSVRRVSPLHRRLSDRGDRRARCDRRRSLPGLAGPGARDVPAGPSGGARRAHLRLRRLPGGLPAQPAGRRRQSRRGRARRRQAAGGRSAAAIEAWVSLLDLLGPTTRRCWPAMGAGTSPGATRGGCAGTRCIAVGNVADPADPDVADALVRYLGDRDPMLRAHAVWACRRLGREDLLDALVGRTSRRWPRSSRRPRLRRHGAAQLGARSGVKHLLVTNDFPPKIGGIQSYLWELWRRLPPDQLRRADQPAQRRGAVGPPAAVPGPAGAGAGAPAPPDHGQPRAGHGGRARRRAGRARPGPAARPDRSVVGPALRRGAPRRRGHRARPPARQPRPCWPTCCAGPGGSSRPAATRRRRGSGRRSGRSMSWSSRRASTSTGSTRSTPSNAGSPERASASPRTSRSSWA